MNFFYLLQLFKDIFALVKITVEQHTFIGGPSFDKTTRRKLGETFVFHSNKMIPK